MGLCLTLNHSLQKNIPHGMQIDWEAILVSKPEEFFSGLDQIFFSSSLFSFLKFKLIFFDYFFIIKIPFSAVSKWFYESLEETPCENDINSLPYIPEVFSTYHTMFCLFNFK